MVKILGVSLSALIVILTIIGISASIKNKKQTEWAKSVPLTGKQQEALWQIWQAYQEGRPPKKNPLNLLENSDREYLKKVLSVEFRPEEFKKQDSFSLKKYEKLKRAGFTYEQLDVIIGMTQNRVGRKDL